MLKTLPGVLWITERGVRRRRGTVSTHVVGRAFPVCAGPGDAGAAATRRRRAGRLGSPPCRAGPPAGRSGCGGTGRRCCGPCGHRYRWRVAATGRRPRLEGRRRPDRTSSRNWWARASRPNAGSPAAGRHRSASTGGGRCRSCWSRRCAAPGPALRTAASRMPPCRTPPRIWWCWRTTWWPTRAWCATCTARAFRTSRFACGTAPAWWARWSSRE